MTKEYIEAQGAEKESILKAINHYKQKLQEESLRAICLLKVTLNEFGYDLDAVKYQEQHKELIDDILFDAVEKLGGL